MDKYRDARDFEVGLSVTTANDSIRKLFEPDAPPIPDRIQALEELHYAGIRTYVMIISVHPGAEGLACLLFDVVKHKTRAYLTEHGRTRPPPYFDKKRN